MAHSRNQGSRSGIDGMRYRSPIHTGFLLVLISLAFLFVGVDKVNEALDPVFEDTEGYLLDALIIKDNGGVQNFISTCFNGQYKIVAQHPLYPLLLSHFATRDLSFFPKAKLLSLVLGLLVVISLFFIVKEMLGETVAFVASALLAFNTSFLIRSSHVDCEPLLILFILLSWYFIVKGFDNSKYWIWAGIAGGLAYMTKGTGLFVLPLFVMANLVVFGSKVIKNKSFWLFFLFFLLASSPLIMRNIIVYKNPLYEGYIANSVWLDSWDDISDPKYHFIVNFKDHTFTANQLPTMLSYIQTHSVSQIAERAAKGIAGESRLFLNTMNMLVFPIWTEAVSSILVVFSAIGLILDKNKNRRNLSLLLIAIFVLPFAWYYQVIAEERYIAPLLPVIVIYSAWGSVALAKHIDTKLGAKLESFSLVASIPYVLTTVLILITVYVAGTQKVYPLIHSVDLSEDRYELLGWFRDHVKEDDVVIFGPTQHYWGLLWYAGFKGKLPITGNGPLVQDSLPAFNTFLKTRNVTLLVLHKENYGSRALEDYFEYDDVHGLVEKRPIRGWKLVYKYSRKPTKFLIYQIEKDESF